MRLDFADASPSLTVPPDLRERVRTEADKQGVAGERFVEKAPEAALAFFTRPGGEPPREADEIKPAG